MSLKKWLSWLALLALLPLAGCIDVNEDESTGDNDGVGTNDGNDDDPIIVIDEGTEVECSGQTDEDGDEVTGSGRCEVQDEG